MIVKAIDAASPIALRAEGLDKVFHVSGSSRLDRHVHAVNRVSLTVGKGSVLGVVGESGSGKSTLIRLIAHLIPMTAGELWLHEVPVPRRLRGSALLPYRRRIQMIFQDPFGALNPYYPIQYQLERPLKNFQLVAGKGALHDAVVQVLEEVGLSPAGDYLAKRPHELSGGQRQRVVIARALVARPEVILADEPTSMLDVSIRMSVLNLLERLQHNLDLSYIFVTHDLASARYLSDHLLVMYAGESVEGGQTNDVIDEAAHPYTQLLLSAVPEPAREVPIGNPEVAGEPPDLSQLPSGCFFHPRCPHAMARCRSEHPQPQSLKGEHWVACHLYG
ncbi:MAG: ABC transporter ATP-binding protein [Firmicutes bacterium]|nr:ABC transporter ATP-binding protein [Bacillota bacterium]